MRRAATSAYALTLVKPQNNTQRSTEVVSIAGRDRVVRRGIYFAVIGKRRRSVYQQFDGKIELADLCTCTVDWRPDFEIIRSAVCVIDEHARQARDDEWGAA
jgi:hypothetical protein